MRVAYVGNFAPPFSTENDVKKAFQYLGHEVYELQEGDKFNPKKASFEQVWDVAHRSDMLLWTGTWGDAYEFNQVLNLFHSLAIKGIPTVTLHLDTFWSTGRGGRQWWQENMFHTAYIFTADGDYQKEWKALGKNHIWLPPAVRHDAAHLGNFREEYACDVAFVGSNGQGYHEDVWTYRKELVDFLRDMCKRNGWSWKNPGGDDSKVDRSNDMNDFYASAKVTVGDSLCLKKEESHYWSDRVPEATGRGGFLIMPNIIDMRILYSNKLPTYEWGDLKGLEEKIGYYLDNPVERKEIVEFVQKRTKDDHTYVNRVKTIIKEVGLQ